MAEQRRALTIAAEVAAVVGTVTGVVFGIIALVSGGSGSQQAPDLTPSTVYVTVAQPPATSPQPAGQSPTSSTSDQTSQPSADAGPAPRTSQHPLGYAFLVALGLLAWLPLTVVTWKVAAKTMDDSLADFGVWLVGAAGILAIWISFSGPVLIIRYLISNSPTALDIAGLVFLWGIPFAGGLAAAVAMAD